MSVYPATPEAIRAIAVNASEAVRALTHATLPDDDCPGLGSPADAYELIGVLAELAGRLPQLLDQISAFLQRQLQLDRVAVDDGEFAGDPLGAVGTACHALDHVAVPSAQLLSGALFRSHQAVAFASAVRDATTR
jgi:hypothetical protein